MTFIVNFDEFCEKKQQQHQSRQRQAGQSSNSNINISPETARRTLEDEDIKVMSKLVHLLQSSSKILVVLGAGISVSAGIPVIEIMLY